MTSEDWDALLFDMPEEVKKWFTFPDVGEGASHHDQMPDQRLAEGSNEQSSEEEGRKEEQDLPILKVLREGLDYLSNSVA